MYYSFHIHTLYLITLASKTVDCYLEVVYNNNTVIQTYTHHEAEFGGTVTSLGLKGRLIYIKRTSNGSCDDYEPAAPTLNGNGYSIALMERMGCKFVSMVYAAQNLNFSAVIVHNNKANGNNLVKMIGSSVTKHFEHKVVIPAVFVGYDNGVSLSQYVYDATNNSIYYVRIMTKEYSTSNQRVPMYAVVVTGIFFFSSMVCIICGCCWKQTGGAVRRYRERRVNRTRSSSVQTDIHLPVLTPTSVRSSMDYLRHIRPSSFSKDDTYDVCPICLDNFEIKEKLWKLPCDHQFHINCIKPCIETIDASCPVCRRMFITSRH